MQNATLQALLPLPAGGAGDQSFRRIFVPDSASSLVTSESILIDGANGVTSAPRAQFPEAAIWLFVAVVVAAIVRLVKRPQVVVWFLVLGGVPGFVHVLALRADAPLRRAAMAESVSATLGELQRLVPWPATRVSVVREDDDVLFPLGRYALPSRGAGPVELELRTGPLGSVCRAESQRVICGAGP